MDSLITGAEYPTTSTAKMAASLRSMEIPAGGTPPMRMKQESDPMVYSSQGV
jgi:hypothetical protein